VIPVRHLPVCQSRQCAGRPAPLFQSVRQPGYPDRACQKAAKRAGINPGASVHWLPTPMRRTPSTTAGVVDKQHCPKGVRYSPATALSCGSVVPPDSCRGCCGAEDARPVPSPDSCAAANFANGLGQKYNPSKPALRICSLFAGAKSSRVLIPQGGHFSESLIDRLPIKSLGLRKTPPTLSHVAATYSQVGQLIRMGCSPWHHGQMTFKYQIGRETFTA